MGGSSSTAAQSPEQQEEESLAASTGSLLFLRTAFSNLASPDSAIPISSLQEALCLNVSKFKLESESVQIPEQFPELISHLGSSIISLFFNPLNKSEITWLDFLKGYNKCCITSPISQSLNNLYSLFFKICQEANFNSNLNLNLGENESESDKVNGSFDPTQMLCFIWTCWILNHGARISKKKGNLVILPDVAPLMNSILGDEREIQVQKFNSWVLSTGAGITHSLKDYMSQKIQTFSSSSEIEENIERENSDKYLLTKGMAWAVSLSLRSTLSDQFSNVSLSGMDENNLLYRSSVNGKGLSRFWSNLEGYNGPVFLLISGFSPNSSDNNNNNNNNDENKWIIGVLTEQGYENKDTYFGNSAYLYSLYPIFNSFSPLGKERNFVYCHVKPTIKVYERNPKIVGLGFGGTIGNERIFLDEDFSKIIIRHHAADKTYQPGSLIPNQGFLAVEGSIMQVEAWGLGGESVKEKQDLFKKRENLFSEQRRTVDLKTFGNWEDSPEKMMMDMVSDPNKARREDR